jgi:4-hydroxy-tetrahydrodipicolinate synthase
MKKLINARGSSAIPMTPFLENGEVDYRTLEKEIDWICSQNVGSICGPVNVSEFMVLSEDERDGVVKTTIETAKDRTCIIANVAATNTRDAVKYTEKYEKLGADAVIAMPPYVGELNFNGVKDYFSAIARSTSLPVMVQNMPFTNISLSIDNVIELCSLAPNISWVKQETPPAPSGVEELKRKMTPDVEGYMSGYSGIYSLQDHANGATATIHAAQFCDVMQRIWDLLDEGRNDEARELHSVLVPALVLEGIYTWQYTKIIMEKRGIFKNHITRNKSNVITESAMKEFDAIWDRVKRMV